MKCRRCGRDVPPNANQCVYCNAPLVKNATPMQNRASSDKKSSKALIISIIALVVVLAILLATYAATYFLPKKRFGGNTTGDGFSTGSAAFALDVSRHDVALWSKDNKVYLYAHTSGLPSGVNLYDENGTYIKAMHDDGNTKSNGDQVAGDGIYTTVLRMDPTEEGNYGYYALTDKDERSNTQIISVVKNLTKKELANIEKVDKALVAMKNTKSFKAKSAEERKTEIYDKLTALAKQGLIEADSIVYSEAGQVYSFYYASGVVGGVKLYPFDDTDLSGKIGTQTGNFTAEAHDGVQPYVPVALSALAKYEPMKLRVFHAFGQPEDNADSEADWRSYTLHLAFDEYHWMDVPGETSNIIFDSGYSSNVDGYVSVEDIKTLDKYNLAYIAAHGMSMNFKRNANARYWYSQRGADETLTTGFALLEKGTKEKDKKYGMELKTGRMFKVDGYYFITPGFIDEHYMRGDLKNTMLYFGSSQLMGADGVICEDWTTALEAKSVKAFIGFHNSVYIGYSLNMYYSMLKNFYNVSTIEQSIERAKDIIGSNDSEWYLVNQDIQTDGQPIIPSGYPILRGDGNARLLISK